jgi:hypothetical protein
MPPSGPEPASYAQQHLALWNLCELDERAAHAALSLGLRNLPPPDAITAQPHQSSNDGEI